MENNNIGQLGKIFKNIPVGYLQIYNQFTFNENIKVTEACKCYFWPIFRWHNVYRYFGTGFNELTGESKSVLPTYIYAILA